MSDVDRRFRTSNRAQPPSRSTLTIAAVLVVANLLLFALIAEDLLDGGGLISHDEAVSTWFVEHRTDALISAAKVVSTIGSFVSLAIVGRVARPLVVAPRVARGPRRGPGGVPRAREPRLHRQQGALRPGAPAGRAARHHGHPRRLPVRPRDRRRRVLRRRVPHPRRRRSPTTDRPGPCSSRPACSSRCSSVSAGSCSASTGSPTSSPAGRWAVRSPSPSSSRSGTSARAAEDDPSAPVP